MRRGITRRTFIGAAAGAGVAGMLRVEPAMGGVSMSERPADARALYESLLVRWCDALVALQVREIRTPGIYGGILCPLCSRIHGRSADAIQPLMRMAHATGDARYLDAAVRLQAWSDHVSRSDGSWVNEAVGSDWKGITAFGLLAHGESLRHHGALLDARRCAGAGRSGWLAPPASSSSSCRSVPGTSTTRSRERRRSRSPTRCWGSRVTAGGRASWRTPASPTSRRRTSCSSARESRRTA